LNDPDFAQRLMWFIGGYFREEGKFARCCEVFI
jgi:hypothetical protein